MHGELRLHQAVAKTSSVIYPLILDNILQEVMNRPPLHGCSHVSTRQKDALPPWL